MTETNTEECCPPAQSRFEGPMSGQKAQKQLAEMAGALGHPIRVAILRLLIERNECICGELVEELPVAQSTVSQHLKKLKEARLIRGSVDGPRVCYCVEPAALQRFVSLFDAILGSEHKEQP